MIGIRRWMTGMMRMTRMMEMKIEMKIGMVMEMTTGMPA